MGVLSIRPPGRLTCGNDRTRTPAMRWAAPKVIVRVSAVTGAALVFTAGVVATHGLADGPPPGATALCRDGTYSFSQTHSGTCSHHGGVAQWLDGGAAPATTAPPTTAPAPTPTTPAASTATVAVARPTTAAASPKPAASSATSCNPGFVSATIAGSHKCLHAGEFCTHAYDVQYRRYGFRCIRYYANVRRYRLTHA